MSWDFGKHASPQLKKLLSEAEKVAKKIDATIDRLSRAQEKITTPLYNKRYKLWDKFNALLRKEREAYSDRVCECGSCKKLKIGEGK